MPRHPALTPTCVWRLTDEVVLALDQRFGEPTDAYVNGSQTWLRDDGPDEMVIEYRLHPVGGYRRPDGADTYTLFPSIALAIASGDAPLAAPAMLWDGLEAFPAYGDEIEPAPLAALTADALGIPPDASGLVDHEALGDEWERAGGTFSITDRLLSTLDNLDS